MDVWIGGVPWALLGVGLLLALLISALGFKRSDWFISLGYGFSITALAVLFGLANLGSLGLLDVLQLVLLAGYGLRLALHLIQRERAASFGAELAASEDRSRRIQGGVKVAIWIGVSLLYVTMAGPTAFVLPVSESSAVQVLGVLLMAAGLALEGVADAEKSAAKRERPGELVTTGLYRWVRFPNYFGEMVFWLGHFVTGVATYRSVAAWLIATVGLVCIQLVMLGSARRLELKQSERYSGDSFETYVATVPVLIPFVPLRTLKNLKIYLG